ncbi:hypothetical protein [Hydrogenophaga defluvii]|uniref:Uncharacterized protein n=1 Tax=Hydrogenophaga defluvii TaxID=249410 RepID=A0ABW2SH61_9BURK
MNLNPINKPLSDVQAAAALMGATVVPIEGDTGRPEFVFTDGPVTLRTGNLATLQKVVTALRQRKEVAHVTT